MRVLLCGTSFECSYGGPAVSVSRLGAALANCGVEVVLWAPDGSAASSPVIRDAPNLKRTAGKLADVLRASPPPDIVHDNGLWLPHNHAIAGAAKRLAVPRVVALRGMLEPWALANRRWKKRIGWYLYQHADLEAAAVLHATADSEAENARTLGLRRPIVVIPNGVDLDFPHGDRGSNVKRTGTPRHRRALFLSRIHRKKGLPMLLEAWAALQPREWELVIAGPSEERHDEEIRGRIAKLGLAPCVTIDGPVYGAQKQELYRSADLFVLPTYSENFGIVIAEALAHEVPVLTTTGAPWQLLVEERCGWWVAPTPDGIRAGLKAAISASDEERTQMGLRGRHAVKTRFAWDHVARDVCEKLYAPLLSGRSA